MRIERCHSQPKLMRRPSVVGALVACLLSTGCAFHYHDARSGSDHVWGFGHLQTRVNAGSNGVMTIVSGVRSLGLGVSSAPEQTALTAGWSVRHRIAIPQDSAVSLTWSKANPFDALIASVPSPGQPSTLLATNLSSIHTP